MLSRISGLFITTYVLLHILVPYVFLVLGSLEQESLSYLAASPVAVCHLRWCGDSRKTVQHFSVAF
jgi:hypothetical protein